MLCLDGLILKEIEDKVILGYSESMTLSHDFELNSFD